VLLIIDIYTIVKQYKGHRTAVGSNMLWTVIVL